MPRNGKVATVLFVFPFAQGAKQEQAGNIRRRTSALARWRILVDQINPFDCGAPKAETRATREREYFFARSIAVRLIAQRALANRYLFFSCVVSDNQIQGNYC
jgi:hypothetical protein